MTEHSHLTPVEGCYRCELGADEAMTDPRIERIERGIGGIGQWDSAPLERYADAALADLCAWQEIAERHTSGRNDGCVWCYVPNTTCPDRAAADAAIDRLDNLWGTDG